MWLVWFSFFFALSSLLCSHPLCQKSIIIFLDLSIFLSLSRVIYLSPYAPNQIFLSSFLLIEIEIYIYTYMQGRKEGRKDVGFLIPLLCVCLVWGWQKQIQRLIAAARILWREALLLNLHHPYIHLSLFVFFSCFCSFSSSFGKKLNNDVMEWRQLLLLPHLLLTSGSRLVDVEFSGHKGGRQQQTNHWP